MRLFWVPTGCDASEGAYVHLPFDELLAIVALESTRHRTVVVGEDLGTVDPDVQKALGERGVLSYKLVYFERKSDGSFKPSHEYPPQALAAISTHDLPTLAGWWTGHDLAVRRELELFPTDALYESQKKDRDTDRRRLLETLRHAGLLTDDDAKALEPLGATPPSIPLSAAAHTFLGATPSQLAMVQLEDLTGTPEQANMPGTTTEHPNWRRKLTMDFQDIGAHDPAFMPLMGLRHLRNGNGNSNGNQNADNG
jgi:(1->4)-alpha-D-glucan 1-alpha-D-glucosylmutase